MTIQALPEPSHSGLGIASFVVSMVSGLCTFLIFVYAGIKENSLPGGVAENSSVAISIGLALFLMWILQFVGTVFALVALFEKNRKKVFAVLGLIFNLGLLAISALLIVIGATT